MVAERCTRCVPPSLGLRSEQGTSDHKTHPDMPVVCGAALAVGCPRTCVRQLWGLAVCALCPVPVVYLFRWECAASRAKATTEHAVKYLSSSFSGLLLAQERVGSKGRQGAAAGVTPVILSVILCTSCVPQLVEHTTQYSTILCVS